MPSWFSEGTVTVTNGSTVVTGALTRFSNCRAGDMFVGPDNGIYQIINPSSDTSVSISPAYRGPTSAGAGYGIVPVNGYPKALADAVNLLVQQWGATLAGLGSVSVENIVPVAKGGTGSSTPAAARTALGLGNAATATIGLNPGNVMGVGAFGLGVTYSPGLTLRTDVLGSQVAQTGISRYSADTAGRPPFGSGYGVLQHFSATNDGTYNYGALVAIDYAATELMMCRLAGSAGWSPWAKFYSTANTTRAADGTLKAI
ncbi:hypothetical protein [Pseudomonas sp. 31 R 17]|uniref:hypothetical protein n=1 Tax=Pseudomonas sp. 31 R 17 TaxID=1844101 RepID=UPI0008127737|nr:hypothetical protein [Pseudomonas sp. 31 R 17]CRM71300.1 hypothetical protein [Pseudomonas sp. 31 R 17]